MTDKNLPVTRSVGALDFDRGFSEEQTQLLKDTICKGATDDELKLFMYVAQRRKLDPFAKQVHPVKRWDKGLNREVLSFQTAIDGYRLIAQRTGKYRGQVGPLWCGKDGKWVDVWLDKEPPAAAKVGVKHEDFDEPIWAVATWDSYVQTTKDGKVVSMWQKMPDGQLAKCAESLALRKAFPEDLAGLHTDEEMAQAENNPPAGPTGDKVARLQSIGKPPAKEVEAVVESAPLESGPISDAGDYKIHDGPLKDKALRDVPIPVLTDFYHAVMKKFKNEPKGRWAEFKARVDEYLSAETPIEPDGPGAEPNFENFR